MYGSSSVSKLPLPFACLTNWQGGSGRAYVTVGTTVEEFVLDDAGIYILVAKGRAAWVGTAQNLIEDHVSRTKFQASVNTASTALRVNKPSDEIAQMSLICDLETGHEVAELNAA